MDMGALKSGSRTAGPDGDLQGSANYVFYDAGATGDDEKKKRKSKSGAAFLDDDDSPQKTKAKSRSTAKLKAAGSESTERAVKKGQERHKEQADKDTKKRGKKK